MHFPSILYFPAFSHFPYNENIKRKPLIKNLFWLQLFTFHFSSSSSSFFSVSHCLCYAYSVWRRKLRSREERKAKSVELKRRKFVQNITDREPVNILLTFKSPGSFDNYIYLQHPHCLWYLRSNLCIFKSNTTFAKMSTSEALSAKDMFSLIE